MRLPASPRHAVSLPFFRLLVLFALFVPPLAAPALAHGPGYHAPAHQGHARHRHADCPPGMVRDAHARALHDGRPLQNGCRRAHGPGFIERHSHRHRGHHHVPHREHARHGAHRHKP